MGVWIETILVDRGLNIVAVTPCVGVWIETSWQQPPAHQTKSHPAWVCGLKHYQDKHIALLIRHTLRGCVD